MVDKFKKLVSELEDSHGPVYIFAIMQMDDLVDKWSIILSAPWAGPDNFKAIFREIQARMFDLLSQEELSTIARLGIWQKDEHLVEMLLNYKQDSVIENQKINGNMVYKGFILQSNREPQTKTASFAF